MEGKATAMSSYCDVSLVDRSTAVTTCRLRTWTIFEKTTKAASGWSTEGSVLNQNLFSARLSPD